MLTRLFLVTAGCWSLSGCVRSSAEGERDAATPQGSSQVAETAIPKKPSPPSPATQADRPVATAGTLPRLWVFPAMQDPAFCLALNDDGTARFYGDFLRFNPVTWRYDTLGQRLDLTLSNLTPGDQARLNDDLLPGYLAFDSTNSVLSYTLTQGEPQLRLFGWVLRASDKLAVWQMADAAKTCPLLRSAGGA
jgi:hypothetical protein